MHEAREVSRHECVVCFCVFRTHDISKVVGVHLVGHLRCRVGCEKSVMTILDWYGTGQVVKQESEWVMVEKASFARTNEREACQAILSRNVRKSLVSVRASPKRLRLL